MKRLKCDFLIVGAGIIGLSVAYNLLKKQPSLKVAIIDKESSIAQHQTGHNSGVIHSGVYYKPDSLKAKNCIKGRELLLHFCKKHNIPFKICGKYIVATEQNELEALHNLHSRALANGLKDAKLVTPKQLSNKEPHIHSLESLFIPETGIIDFVDVSKALAQEIQERKGLFFFNEQLLKGSCDNKNNLVKTSSMEFHASQIINCAGLHSTAIMALLSPNKRKEIKIIPFRGEYYTLKSKCSSLVNTLIYPVPNPKFPFLGVHFTKMLDGKIEAGPNAILAFAQEGYSYKNISIKELASIFSFPGFWKILAKHWKIGCYELYRSLSKNAFLKDLNRFLPDLKSSDLAYGGSGVRAQAVNKKGELLDDFSIEKDGNITHVLNAPSPAATASLAIGEYILEKTL